MGPEATARSNAYFEGGYIVDFAGTALSIIVAGLFLFFGWVRGVRSWLERIVKFYPLVAFGASAFYLLVSSVLTFPFVYYVGFVREHRYGLSTQTLPEWFSEQMMGFGLTLVIGSIFLTILYLIVRAAKNTWWIWGTAVTTVFTAVLIMAGPVYIDPLFNTYTPMQEGELKTSILEMAQANGVPADDVLVFDTSHQSNRITANVAGLFGTTRVALGDNLLECTSPEAVRAVMGHELGHYVLGHIYSLLIARPTGSRRSLGPHAPSKPRAATRRTPSSPRPTTAARWCARCCRKQPRPAPSDWCTPAKASAPAPNPSRSSTNSNASSTPAHWRNSKKN